MGALRRVAEAVSLQHAPLRSRLLLAVGLPAGEPAQSPSPRWGGGIAGEAAQRPSSTRILASALTSEFPVSSNAPTFQMGKPRPRETGQLTQDSSP